MTVDGSEGSVANNAPLCSRRFQRPGEAALIVVIAGAGGVGKGTVVRALIERDPQLWLSRSWTTRDRRPGEPEDAYVFTSRADFDAMIERDGFLEWAEFQGNRYGTPWPETAEGRDVVLEIDVQGAEQVHVRDVTALVIFLVPPSMAELRARLVGRGDPADKIEARLAIAEVERARAAALGAIEIVNDELAETVDEVRSAISSAHEGL